MWSYTYDFGRVSNSNTVFALNSNRILSKRIESTVSAVMHMICSRNIRACECAYTTA